MKEEMDHESTPPTPKWPGDTALTERYKRAKLALAKADHFYKSELFWKAFEEGEINEFQVLKVERMAETYELQRPKNEPPREEDDPMGELLDMYELGEIETMQDLADQAETLAMRIENELLLNAVKDFREWQKEDWELAGRGDGDEAEATLINGIKRARTVYLPERK